MSILEALKEVEKVEELIVAIGTQLVSEVYNRDYTDMYCEEFFVDENNPKLVTCLLRFNGRGSGYANITLSIPGTLLDNPTKKDVTAFIEHHKKAEEDEKKRQEEVAAAEKKQTENQLRLDRYVHYKELKKEFGDKKFEDT